jgi:hypothetical protein
VISACSQNHINIEAKIIAASSAAKIIHDVLSLHAYWPH